MFHCEKVFWFFFFLEKRGLLLCQELPLEPKWFSLVLNISDCSASSSDVFWLYTMELFVRYKANKAKNVSVKKVLAVSILKVVHVIFLQLLSMMCMYL